MDWIWVIIVLVVIVAKVLGSIETGNKTAAPGPAKRRPPQRPLPSTPPRVPPKAKTGTGWAVAQDDIQRFLNEIQQRTDAPRPTPPPPPPPPPVMRQAQPVPPPPPPPPPVTHPPVKSQAAEQPVAPRSAWAEALRDPNNLRNVIISAEIIGPPKALERSE